MFLTGFLNSGTERGGKELAIAAGETVRNNNGRNPSRWPAGRDTSCFQVDTR